ncbi:hypothetical protein GQ53DRAFT_179440 [Thozetella sp. PMI_491]|nr:hypothetical protein GQ53DRAFT_179440 [Thozetella sp. PMI_491]
MSSDSDPDPTPSACQPDIRSPVDGCKGLSHYVEPPVNVFGNGWTGDLPLPYTASRAMGRGRALPNESISSKLVHLTLQRGYIALKDAGAVLGETAHHSFCFSLSRHSREELLFNMRWFLGPGYSELHHLARASFGGVTKMLPAQLPSLDPIVDLAALQPTGIRFPPEQSPFLNANEVETYLRSKNVYQVDENILEISMETRDPGPLLLPQLDKTISKGPAGFLDLDLFFPSTERLPTSERNGPMSHGTTSIRIFQSLLLHHLSETSVCLAYGFGYRKEELEQAILASSVTSF